MYVKSDLARIINDRFTLRGGKRTPKYLAEWMVDYVFEAIKIALIEDGKVNIKNTMSFERIDVPEHEKLMPDRSTITIPARSKIRIKANQVFIDEVNSDEIKEKKFYDH